MMNRPNQQELVGSTGLSPRLRLAADYSRQTLLVLRTLATEPYVDEGFTSDDIWRDRMSVFGFEQVSYQRDLLTTQTLKQVRAACRCGDQMVGLMKPYYDEKMPVAYQGNHQQYAEQATLRIRDARAPNRPTEYLFLEARKPNSVINGNIIILGYPVIANGDSEQEIGATFSFMGHESAQGLLRLLIAAHRDGEEPA